MSISTLYFHSVWITRWRFTNVCEIRLLHQINKIYREFRLGRCFKAIGKGRGVPNRRWGSCWKKVQKFSKGCWYTKDIPRLKKKWILMFNFLNYETQTKTRLNTRVFIICIKLNNFKYIHFLKTRNTLYYRRWNKWIRLKDKIMWPR